jgi:hypothetical protein
MSLKCMGLESAFLEPVADPGKRKVPDVESRPADRRGAPANTVSARGDWRSSGRPCRINALDAGELSPSTCRGSTCWCRSALMSLFRALASPHQADDHTSACKRWRLAVSAFLLFGPASGRAGVLMLFQAVSIRPSVRWKCKTLDSAMRRPLPPSKA